MEISQAPEVKKTERLSDTEMGNLLSAFGNHEAKAITLIAMSPGIIYTRKDLYDRIIELQGERKGWRMNMEVPFQYCEDSLSPIGLVTQEVLDHNLNTFGYIKSGYGEEIGVPLAGSLLKFSEAHSQHTLFDFFTKTASPSKKLIIKDGMESKKRAPTTRLKILWELATLDFPIKLADLVVQLGEPSSIIGRHLNILMKKGLISYETNELLKPVSFYKLSPDHPQDHPVKGRRPARETFVYQALLDNPDKEWTTDSMTNLYLIKTGKTNTKGLISTTSEVFSHFLKTGYVVRGRFSKERHTEINLTPEQRKVIVDLVTILDGFQNKDSKIIKEGRDFANHLLTHPEAVSKLLFRAKEHSSAANATPREDTEQMILEVISSSGIPLVNQNIQKLLKSNYGKILSLERMSAIAYSLSQQGRIVAFTQKGGIKSYGSLPDPDSEQADVEAPERM